MAISLQPIEVHYCERQDIENGVVSSQQLQDIASKLDRRVGGEIRRQVTQRPASDLGRTTGRVLLGSWYRFSLFEESSSQKATSQLVAVLRHPDIGLLPLAAQIERNSSVLPSSSGRRTNSCCAHLLRRLQEQVQMINDNYLILLQETALLSLQQKFEQLQKEYLNLLHGTECEELLLGKGAFGGRIFRKRRFNQNFIVEKVESKSFDPLKVQSIQCHKQFLSPFHIYKEGVQQCLLFEDMEIAGSFASNILNQTTSHKEKNLWRFISQISGVLKFLHRNKSGAITLREGLSPDSLQATMDFDRDIRERGLRWKLLSKEMGSQQTYYCTADDIFSLGCLIVFRLTKGHRLSKPISSSELSEMLPEGYSPCLYKLLASMLHPQPEERPTAGQVEQVTFENGRQEMGQLVVLPHQVANDVDPFLRL